MNSAIFGTDGIRGAFSKDILSVENCIKIGLSIGKWMTQTYQKNEYTIALARDTRASGHVLQMAVQAGLLQYPCTIIDIGVMPVSALHYFIRKKIIDVGIMLSASHNKFSDNGIKVLLPHAKLDDTQEENITHNFHTTYTLQAEHLTPETGTLGTVVQYAYADEYIPDIVSQFPAAFLTGKTVVLDCAHGATLTIAPKIFQLLGADVHVINHTPNGTNINKECGVLYPEQLKKAVIEHNATLGFAFDGDGDRVSVCSRGGEKKDGDAILAVLSTHPAHMHIKKIVGTILSNSALDLFLHQSGKELVRAGVGDKAVANMLRTHHTSIGGEPAGHIVLYDHLPSSDGIFSALKICETACLTNNWDLTTFTPFYQFNASIEVKEKKNLSDSTMRSIIDFHEKMIKKGRLIVRYSGTEPLLRIMIEEEDKQEAHMIGQSLVGKLKEHIT